jgi:hypothetical protein
MSYNNAKKSEIKIKKNRKSKINQKKLKIQNKIKNI